MGLVCCSMLLQVQIKVACNQMLLKKTDIPIRLFSIDMEHILQYTGFSNVRPAPPAWSRDMCWEWLPVTEWAVVRGGGAM